MSDQNEVTRLYYLYNYISVATITLISYEYLFLFEKEVKFVWQRPWSLMSCLYLVRYLGVFIAIVNACWGGLIYMPETPCHDVEVLPPWCFSVYLCFAEVILIWRLYALCDQSKRLLYALLLLFFPVIAIEMWVDIYLYSRRSVYSVKEIVTPIAKYCTFSITIEHGPEIYSNIPLLCYDIVLAVLAASILVKHIRERRDVHLRPNIYIIIIVRCHIICFVLNLINQILMMILWAPIPMPMTVLAVFSNGIAQYIYVPRLIISIWDTHAHNRCIHISTAFEDCVCWTSPDWEVEMDSRVTI